MPNSARCGATPPLGVHFRNALADGRLELILAEERERAKEGSYMLMDQKLRIAWKAYLAELAAMQMAEHPSKQVVA